jgi:hypothetical protein
VLYKTIADQFIVVPETEIRKKQFLNIFNDSFDYFHLLGSELKKSKSKIDSELLSELKTDKSEDFLIIIIVDVITQLKYLFDNEELINNYISELMLTRPIKSILKKNLKDAESIGSKMLLINLLLQIEDQFENYYTIDSDYFKLRSPVKLYEYLLDQNKAFINDLINTELFTTYLGVNTYKDKTYYSKERLDDFIDTVVHWNNLKYLEIVRQDHKSNIKQKNEYVRFAKKSFMIGNYLKKQSQKSEYLYKNLAENLGLKIKSF